MATVTKKSLRQEVSHAGAFGNRWSQIYTFETNSSGIFVNSDLATAVQNGDVVRFGLLPAGIKFSDALVIISDAFATSTTYKLGFAYVDGVDSTAVRPLTLPKDAYLILTRGGAADSAVGIMDVIVNGTLVGV